MYVLVVQTGKFKGKKIKVVGSEVLIGRDEDAGIRIGSDDVSREHCLLTPTEHGVTVRDLDSRNGTFIDGVPLGANEDAVLAVGSSLTVGPMTFQLATTQPRKTPKHDQADAKQGLSDDDISTWLTEADTGEILSASDTTIVVGRDPKKTSAPPIQPPKKREFKSVAEEAEDIFRRYREMKARAEGGQEPVV
ncbi:MAG: FHA domain-containing protein [Planctomycetaceae bacterium]